MKKREIVADLHNHSTVSDGEFRPAELVAKGREIGLKAIGITDHDSIEGLDEGLAEGRHRGIMVIPGVEVSLRFMRPFFTGTLHLLLYFSEELLGSEAFRRDITALVSAGRGGQLVRDRINAVNSVFGPGGKEPLLERNLTVDEVMAHGENITRRHFFLALSKDHGIEDKPVIDRIIGNRSPAYIPSGIETGLLKPLFDAYPLVKVFAHPAAGSFPGDSHYKEVLPPLPVIEQLLPEFLNPGTIGIDGIEVYYPGHNEELENCLLRWTMDYDLLITGGSDCHDSLNRPLGVSGVTEPELQELLEKIG